MVESYREMTLGQLLQIDALKDINAAPAVKEMSIVSILSGVSMEELKKTPKRDYDDMLRNLDFLAQDNINYIQIAEEVELNGTRYTIWHDVGHITTGQYIDWCSHIQTGGTIIDLLSCFIIPKGHSYAEDYNIDKVKEDIYELPMPIANFISVFWQSSLARYIVLSARELKKRMKKLPKIIRKMSAKCHQDIGGTASRPSTTPSE